MAQGDGNRVIRNAPYRYTFGAYNNQLNLVSGIGGSMAPVAQQDAGGYVAAGGTPTEHAATGTYFLDLTALEMTGDEVDLVVTQASMNDEFINFDFEPGIDSGVTVAAASASITLRAAIATDADDHINGATIEIVRGTGAGQVRSIIDYANGTQIATIDRAWITVPDGTSIYLITGAVGPKLTTDIRVAADVLAINGNTVAAVNQAIVFKGVINGTINDVTPSTTVFDGDAGFHADDDYYNKALCVMVTGPNAGLTRKVFDYDGTNKTFTVDSVFPVVPTNGDEFYLIAVST